MCLCCSQVLWSQLPQTGTHRSLPQASPLPPLLYDRGCRLSGSFAFTELETPVVLRQLVHVHPTRLLRPEDTHGQEAETPEERENGARRKVSLPPDDVTPFKTPPGLLTDLRCGQSPHPHGRHLPVPTLGSVLTSPSTLPPGRQRQSGKCNVPGVSTRILSDRPRVCRKIMNPKAITMRAAHRQGVPGVALLPPTHLKSNTQHIHTLNHIIWFAV